MDERTFTSALEQFLKRYLRVRFINRIIAYVLVNLAVYLLLLAALVLCDLSLFVFHLLFFVSLSLLPLFLLLGAERTTLRGIVRSFDRHCLLESYLSTESVEHHTFMGNRVETYLESKQRQKPFPFHLLKANRYLIGVCLLLFVVLQGITFMMLEDLSIALSAQELKKKLAEQSILELALDEVAGEDAGQAPLSEAGQPESTPEGETGDQRIGKTADEEALEELLPDESLAAGERIQRLKSDELGEDSEPSGNQERGEGTMKIPGKETDRTAKRNAGIPQEEGLDSSREGGGGEAGGSDVGRSFEASPLRDYATRGESLQAAGEEELSPSTNLSEGRRGDTLPVVFADFGRISYLSITFDPLFDTIRERYLELLDERY